MNQVLQYKLTSIRGMCNSPSSVSLQQKFEAVDWCYSSVTAQFYLASKGKYILEACVQANPIDKKRRERLNCGSSFYVFLLPLSLHYVNWAIQEGCLFHLRFSLRSSDHRLLYIHGLYPFFVF